MNQTWIWVKFRDPAIRNVASTLGAGTYTSISTRTASTPRIIKGWLPPLRILANFRIILLNFFPTLFGSCYGFICAHFDVFWAEIAQSATRPQLIY